MNTAPYEGMFASPALAMNLEILAPFRSVTAGPWAPVSNVPGTVQSRFGWLNSSTNQVNNTRVDASDALGVVVPLRSMRGVNAGVIGGALGLAGTAAASTWQFYDPTVTPAGGLRIRPGLPVTLMSSGNFYLAFAGGAIVGSVVYASLADGHAISGPADNAEATPWLVVSEARPGCLAMVSTAASFSA